MFLLTNNIYKKNLEDTVLREVDDVIRSMSESLSDATEGLTFDAENHIYTYNGREIPCVSDYVSYFAPFDSREKALGASRNPRNIMFGKSVEEILAVWDEKRDLAAANGTHVHAFAEACCLWWQGLTKEIEHEFRDRITPDGFLAETPQEEAVARFWEDLDPTRYAVVAKETRVFNPILNYAGTLDLLLYDIERKGLLLRDYKTNEDIRRWFGGHLRTPLNFLKDNDEGKYTLQQNMYSLQLENLNEFPVLDIELIWLRQDGGYETIGIQKMEPAVAYALKNILDTGTKIR